MGDACLTMGRDLAAVALAIDSTKDPEHFRTPGGYFHGMVQNTKAGELPRTDSVGAAARRSAGAWRHEAAGEGVRPR
jgi:hypothetical protein